MFINLEMDPRIPSLLSLLHLCESSSSNSVRTSAHVRTRTLLGLLLTSALGHSLDSHSCPHSDITRTLLGPLLTSALGRYSDSCSLPHSDSTQNPAPVVLSIHLSEVLACLIAILYSRIPTSLGAPHLSALRVLGTPLRRPLGHPCLNSSYKSEPAPSDPVQTSVLGPRSDLRPCPRYHPNPCHPTLLGGPLGHLCLAPPHKFEPAPSGPARASVIVRVTSATRIRTARNRLAEHEMFHMAAVTHTKAIREVEEPCIIEANAMAPPQQEEPVTNSNAETRTNNDDLTVASSMAKELPVPFIWQNNVDSENRPNLEKLCRKAYLLDRIFKKILSHPKDHKS
jgi:hypothetical protein